MVIEVTRMCQLKCQHCLRGTAQNKIASLEDVDTLMSKTEHISTLTFTGGEPALVPDMIEGIRYMAQKNKTEIGNFYVATSTVAPEESFKEFIVACLEFHLFCTDNEISQINWSNDSFHKLNDRNVRLLKLLSFASPKYDDSHKDKFIPAVIAEGRGEKFGGRKPTEECFVFDDDRITEGNLYLNCLGEIISGCDWSYKNQSKHKICNVSELTLTKIKQYMRKAKS